MLQSVDLNTEYEELLEAYKLSQLELARAKNEDAYALACHERDIAIAAYHEMSNKASVLEAKLEYAKIELSRKEEEARETRALQHKIKSHLAICAIPHEKLGPYQKLALITGPEQIPYSASLHGGNDEILLTSMKQWNKAIGGNEDNTNCLNKALKALEGSGTVIRDQIECPDGRKHYQIGFNEDHMRNPRLIEPQELRKDNGGNKRCPACGEYCKTRMTITYECLACGIDYDGNMIAIDHTVTSTPGPALATSVTIVQTSLPDIVRVPPLACHTCGNVYSHRWSFNEVLKKWLCLVCHESKYTGSS